MKNHLSKSNFCHLTVAIPVYNGAQRLPKVLEGLRQQKVDKSLHWEIIVSDNNSVDSTATVVRKYQANWSSTFKLRYCFAAQQGAAFARQRAVELARGELVAFLDDDNVPALDWVNQVYSFASRYPDAGAFGSMILGEYESPPPSGFEPLYCFLAIVDRGNVPHCYLPKSKILPPGAGLAVRREAWLNNVPKNLFLNHKGKSFGLASEDLEALFYIQKAGWDVWYNPKMIVYHQIPQERLTEEYLVSLLRCIGLSRYYIRMLRVNKSWKLPLTVPAYMLNDLYRLATHWVRQISGSNAHPVVVACQREYLNSTVASPFFLTNKVVKDAWQRFKEPMPDNCEAWLGRLTRAFEDDSFQLYGQPVVALDNHSKHTEFQTEVLLRLAEITETGQLRLVSPKDFEIAANYLGLFRTIDYWVLRTFFEKRPVDSVQTPDLSASDSKFISFNISIDSITDSHFTNFLSDQIIASNYPAERLCFEVSIQAFFSHPEQTSKFIHELREIGCKVTLDSCLELSFLQEIPRTLPIDFCKIDSCLLNIDSAWKVRKSSAHLKIVREWSSHKNIQTIVKGVENDLLLKLTKQAKFLYAQGYALANPRPLIIPLCLDSSIIKHCARNAYYLSHSSKEKIKKE